MNNFLKVLLIFFIEAIVSTIITIVSYWILINNFEQVFYILAKLFMLLNLLLIIATDIKICKLKISVASKICSVIFNPVNYWLICLAYLIIEFSINGITINY